MSVKSFLGVILCSSFLLYNFPTIAYSQCNKAEAQSIINDIVNQGLAQRRDDGITIHYFWGGSWYTMGKGQQYNLIDGLGGAENCLRENVTVRIHVGGKNVARASHYLGKIEVY